MRRLLAVLVALAAVAGTVRAADLAAHARPNSLSLLSLVSVACYGKQRWAVKTLSDPARSTVNFSPTKAGVDEEAALAELLSPHGVPPASDSDGSAVPDVALSVPHAGLHFDVVAGATVDCGSPL